MNSDPRELAERPLDHAQVALRRWAGVHVFRSLSGPGTFIEHEHAEIQLSVRMVEQRAESLCIVPSGVPHAGTLGQPAEFLLVYVEPEHLRREAFDLADRSSIDVRDRGSDRWLESALGSMHEELQSGSRNALVAEAFGHAVVSRLLTSHSSLPAPAWSRVRPLDAAQIREACGLLGEALTVGVGVADVARHLGMGTSRFAKAFRAAVGIPPYTYVLIHRVQRATQLLRETDTPLARVALMSGFASQSHMTTQVRKRTGRTPGEIRQDRERR